MNNFLQFIKQKQGRLFIQTHNFPDHDAVASAFALQRLLFTHSIDSRIIYEGEIQRESLVSTIEQVGIPLSKASSIDLNVSDLIIVIDGCKGAKNVTDLPGLEIAVIDHHEVACPESVEFVDIRPSYGACSTLIYEYWKESGLIPDRQVATALMIGLNMDTALLTRDVSANDVHAYSALYTLCDMRLVSSILRNYIQVKDLTFYKRAIEALYIKGNFCFCYFAEGCNQNLLGILGDFFLSLEEALFVVLCANNGGKINLSVRSENPEWNAAQIVEEVLHGIGFGGGHADMAGGIVPDVENFDELKIRSAFQKALGVGE